MSDKVKWVRLGDYIEQCTAINSDLKFGIDDAMGMTITKEIVPTKADLRSTDLSKFLIVKPKEFVYNPRTHGKKIGLGFNNTGSSFIISWNNVAFRVKDPNVFYPDYLYMIISREEWDRNACFRSWGSSTEVFSWSEFCLMEIPLPSIKVQRELVDTYNGLKALAEQNEALIPHLSAVCQAYIVDCRDKYPSVKVGEYLSVDDITNSENRDLEFLGININKEFMPTTATIEGLNKQKYKVLTKGIFVFSGMQTGRDVAIRIGLYSDDTDALISPAYTTFSVAKDKYNKLLPEYLFLQFKRAESDRLGWFYSDSSIRSNLDWGRFCEFQIPLPPIDVQQAIVDVYHCMERAKQIAAAAREKLKTLCPALVQRAAHS